MGGIIAVTGTPGTGKTTISKELAKKLSADHIDLNKYVLEHNKYSTYDLSRNCPIITQKSLRNAVLSEIMPNYRKTPSKWIIIDSHMSHFLPTKAISFLIIVGCSKLKTLERRLKKRKYTEQKVRENLDSEIFEICKIEAIERHPSAMYVDSSKKSAKSIASMIAKTISKT